MPTLRAPDGGPYQINDAAEATNLTVERDHRVMPEIAATPAVLLRDAGAQQTDFALRLHVAGPCQAGAAKARLVERTARRADSRSRARPAAIGLPSRSSR